MRGRDAAGEPIGQAVHLAELNSHSRERTAPSSCIRFSSLTPSAVQRSVGSRTSATTRPVAGVERARHFTPPVP